MIKFVPLNCRSLRNGGRTEAPRSSLTKKLSVCYFNARSICNKLPLLNFFLQNSQNGYDLIFIVETWLTPKTLDSLICPRGYQIIRKDRTGKPQKRGGGILLIYRDSLYITDVTDASRSDLEHVCIQLAFRGTYLFKKYYFCCCYFQPGATGNKVKEYCRLLRRYYNSDYPLYYIGDFNLPNINWIEEKASGTPENELLNLCNGLNLKQHIMEPTHETGSTLDLLLSNKPGSNLLVCSNVAAPFSDTCDHSMIQLELTVPNSKAPTDAQSWYYDFSSGNYQEIFRQLSSINWNELIPDGTSNVQDVYNTLLTVLREQIDSYIPKKYPKNKVQRPRNIKELAKENNRLYQKAKKDTSLKSRYKSLDKLYKTQVKLYYDNLERRICEENNINSFYKYANKKLKLRSPIPPLTLENGKIVQEDSEKASVFNEFFQSVFIEDDGTFLNLPPRLNQILSNINITEEDIKQAISKLTPKTSKTPEEIPATFIKKIGPYITYILKRIFNLSLEQGSLPWQWRVALVTPIHKKGSRNNPKNYRPISLTSVICRLLESIIKDKLLEFLHKNSLIAPSQHGFVPRKSTATQLLVTLNEWTKKYDKGDNLNVIYTDFSKAFDRVSHKKLIQVLYSFGVKGKLLEWLNSFLTNRKQLVYINSYYSDTLCVKSGVPQGSVLGPLLFLLFIEDIQKVCSPGCSAVMFADDCKFYGTDPSALQSTLENIVKFTNKRQISLAEEKCIHLNLSKERPSCFFKFEDAYIQKNDNVKDLGIIVSSNLIWKDHIRDIKTKAFLRCHQILRCFTTNNIWTLLRAYKTYIRPILEYNSSIWNPSSKQEKKDLERVQRYYTRKACRRCKIPYDSYEDRLLKLNIEKLELRRLKADLCMTFKIIHNIVDIPTENMFTFRERPYDLRGHKFTLELTKTKNAPISNNFFTTRIAPTWNSLPEDLVSSNTLNEFKVKLKRHNLVLPA